MMDGKCDGVSGTTIVPCYIGDEGGICKNNEAGLDWGDCVPYDWDDGVSMLPLVMMHERCTHGVPIETIQSHMTNFHHLEANQLIKNHK